MAQVAVTINNRSYRIACDDGQEEHLQRLAQFVDKKVAELVAAVGQIGDTRLLVMASLLVADELSDAYAEYEKLKAGNAGGSMSATEEDQLVATIEGYAKKLEDIASRLEHS